MIQKPVKIVPIVGDPESCLHCAIMKTLADFGDGAPKTFGNMMRALSCAAADVMAMTPAADDERHLDVFEQNVRAVLTNNRATPDSPEAAPAGACLH